LATARALVERRLDSTAGQPAPVRLRRLVGMLARKGYPAGLAYRVVRDALEQTGQDQTADGLDEDEFINAELASGGPNCHRGRRWHVPARIGGRGGGGARLSAVSLTVPLFPA